MNSLFPNPFPGFSRPRAVGSGEAVRLRSSSAAARSVQAMTQTRWLTSRWGTGAFVGDLYLQGLHPSKKNGGSQWEVFVSFSRLFTGDLLLIRKMGGWNLWFFTVFFRNQMIHMVTWMGVTIAGHKSEKSVWSFPSVCIGPGVYLDLLPSTVSHFSQFGPLWKGILGV